MIARTHLLTNHHPYQASIKEIKNELITPEVYQVEEVAWEAGRVELIERDLTTLCIPLN